MAVATYVIEVDWDGDGLFGHASSDITGDMISIQTRTGRDFASQLTGRAAPGSLTVILDNRDGKYSPFQSTSSIFQDAVPGREVRLTTTSPSAQTLWTGFLDEIIPSPRLDGGHTAELRALGPLSKLEEPRISVESQTNVATGTILGDVLDNASWPAADRDIDTGQTVMDRFVVESTEEGESALQVAHDLAEAEARGFLRETRDGKIAFEDRHHRLKSPHTTSQATFTDVPGTANPSYFEIVPESAWEEVYNELIAKVQRQTVGSSTALWTLPESGADSPPLDAGQSITIEAFYPPAGTPAGQGVDGWITPAVGTDITANSQADGLGTNLNGNITVSDVTKGTNTMRFTINNTGAVRAFLTLVQARGSALTKEQPTNVIVRDATSITAYGLRTFPVPSKYISNINDAKSYCDWILSIYKDPIPVVSILFPGTKDSDHLTQAITRDVSDRITINSDERTGLGISGDYFIEAVTHHIRDQGTIHIVGLECSPVGNTGFGPGWILDTSELGTDTVLNF